MISALPQKPLKPPSCIPSDQKHLLEAWSHLSNKAQKEKLYYEISSIDWSKLRQVPSFSKYGKEQNFLKNSESFAPAPYIPLVRGEGEEKTRLLYYKKGEALLSLGKVAVVTLAGGSGTRLFFSKPKGLYPVTPVMKKSFFQLFAEKIQYAQNYYGRTIPWVVMTSRANTDCIKAYFESKHFFGLKDVHFIEQPSSPVLDLQGRVQLKENHTVQFEPNGHGGIYEALIKNNTFGLLKKRNIEIISCFQIDNPLVNCIDPAFIGQHAIASSQMSCKMVKKENWKEKVGIFCKRRHALHVLEYMELPESFLRQKTEQGQLRYHAANIGVYLFSLAFMEKIASENKISYHFICAPKENPTHIKLELFLFDALPFAKKALIVETSRAEEFSPLKNSNGADSPEECIKNQSKLFLKWLQEVGYSLPLEAIKQDELRIEISPLLAPSFEILKKRSYLLRKNMNIYKQYYFE